MIQDPLAMRLLEGDILPGDRVRVDADLGQGEMRFEKPSSTV
jgi:hypothetical protein